MSAIRSWCEQAKKATTLGALLKLKETIPSGGHAHPELRTRIPTLLMGFYLTRKFPISQTMQKGFSELFVDAGRKGHSFCGKLSKRPVWSFIVQFRMDSVYPVLDPPPQANPFMSIHLGGYIGALVKSALKVVSQSSSVEEAIAQRQSHFDFSSVLRVLQGHPARDLPMQELRKAINTQPFPSFGKEQIHRPYQLQVHPKIPKQHRFLIHDAVMNGHTPLLCELLSAATVPQVDFWRRNVAHLCELFSFADIRAILEKYPSLQSQKDGFGRTPQDIRNWKHTLVQNAPAAKLDPTNGGWNPKMAQEHQSQRSDIDIVHYRSLSWEDFARKYLSTLKPVLIRGVPNVEKLQKLWKKDRFLQRHRTLPLEVGDIPYGSSLGRETQKTSVGGFRSRPDAYAFCRLDPKAHLSLLRDIPSLTWFDRFPVVQTQFYQGVIGTGAPMHMHVDAWNLLVYGQKRWFLAPPFQGVYSSTPIMEWLDSYEQEGSILECTQQAGDILYVPKYWSHAVLNTQECIGFAREIFQPYAI